MKKLAIIIPYLSRGGAERVSIYLAEYMNRNKIKCEIITFKEWEYEYSVPSYVKTISCGNPMGFSVVLGIAKDNCRDSSAIASRTSSTSKCLLLIIKAYSSLVSILRILDSQRNPLRNNLRIMVLVLL